MTYQETTEYLFSSMPSFQNVGDKAYKPGLDRVRAFCRELCNPELSYPTIHIAGTNGKGSTSNMLASVLRSAGYRVGLFTSPHLRDFRERMRVDGEMISECEVVDFVAQHREAMERNSLSFFEMTAAMAFDFFARSSVDIAIIECGLGGRLDATNIVQPILSVVTNIALDHTQYLGDTLPQIAAEKGGIIKRGVDIIIGERSEECDEVFREIAQREGAEIYFAEDHFCAIEQSEHATYQEITICDRASNCERYRLDLRGEYQRHNLITLLTVIERLNTLSAHKISIPSTAVKSALESVTQQMHLEGRWQELSSKPLIVCDTGHNLHGLRAVTHQLHRATYKELYCVLGFARDKDLRNILPLFPAECHFIFTRPKVERAFTTAEIAAVADDLGLRYRVVEDVRCALESAKREAREGDMIFVGGSNFVVAEAL